MTNEASAASTEAAAAGAEPMPGGGGGKQQPAEQHAAQRAKKKCKRCPPENKFVDHADDCDDAEVFTSYVDCPRCRCILVSRAKFRKHNNKCQPGRTVKKRRDRFSARELVRYTFEPMKLIVCDHCKKWQHTDELFVAVHELFCHTVDRRGPAPAIARHSAFYPEFGDKFAIPLNVAVEIRKIFSRRGMLQSLPRFKELWRMTELAFATVAPNTVVSSSSPTHTSTPRQPLSVVAVDNKQRQPQKRPISYKYTMEVDANKWNGIRMGNMRGKSCNPCSMSEVKRPAALGLGELSPRGLMERGRTVRVNVRGIDCRSDYTAIVTPTQKKARFDPTDFQKKPTPTATVSVASAVEKSQVSAPADQLVSPKKQVAASVNHSEQRDRFKILLSNNYWVDSYGRSTSPRREHRALIKKPSPSMSGCLTSMRERAEPALVSVDGHLPSGWGTIDVGDRKFVAYKITPGDLTRPSDAAIRLPFVVPMFLAQFPDGSHHSAGPLHTDCNLALYKTAEYRAAGVSSRLTITKLAPTSSD